MELPVNNEIRRASAYLVGAVGAAAIGFVNTPFLTRALSASEYAVYGLLTSFISFVTTLAYLGYDEAYMRFYHERGEPLGRYLIRCVRPPLVMGLAVAIFLLEPSGSLAHIVFGEGIQPIFLLGCSLYLLLGIMQRFFMLTARMEEMTVSYATADIVARLVPLVLIVLGWATVGSVNLAWVAAYLALGSLAAILVVTPALKRAVVSGRELELDSEGLSSRSLLQYGLPLAINNTLVFLVPFLERLLLKGLLGQELLGVYSSAAVFATIIGLLSVSINNVWMPFAFKHYKDDDFDRMFGAVGVGVCLLLAVVCSICIAGRKLLIMILGASFWGAAAIAPDILFGACLVIAGNIFSIGINLSGKSGYNIIAPVVQCLALPLLLCLLVPEFGLVGAGASSLLAVVAAQFTRISIALRMRTPKGGILKSALLLLAGVTCCLLTGVSESLICDLSIGVSLLFFSILICMNDLRTLLVSMTGHRFPESDSGNG